jgi:hypothetical protein
LWHLRAGDGSRVTSHHDAGERKAQLVMADRFRLEKVSSNRGPTEALPGPRVERPWAVPEAVAEALATDPAPGLTAEEVADRLQRFGPNELVERGRGRCRSARARTR